MRILRLFLILVAVVLVDASTPAFAQLFGPPRYDQQPPPSPGFFRQRRPPPTAERQYVPPQPREREAPRGGFFLQRLFPRLGLPAPRWPGGGREQQQQVAPQQPLNADGTPPPVRRRVKQTTFVAVMGDSLAENLAAGLVDALNERPEVGLVRQIRPGVGFLKEHEKSWRMVADEVLARDPPVVAAVVMMGPQDDPPAKAKKPTADDPNPIASQAPWMDAYAAKVDDIALAFRQKNIPLIWVGLPPVEDPKQSADNAFLNELVQQRVTSLGGTFVDVWEGFVDDDEKFMVQGPNLDGRTVRLRMADGLHFTRAGARKLAHYVELELRTILSPKEEGEALADIAKDVDATPIAPGSSRILMLGEAPRTPGAVLVPAEADGPQQLQPDVELAAKAMKEGEIVPAKPGRADDFRWPQGAQATAVP